MLRFVHISSLILICLTQLAWNQLVIQPNEPIIHRNEHKSFIALCMGERDTKVLAWTNPSEYHVEENKHARISIERKTNSIQLRIRNLTRNEQGKWTCLGIDHNGKSFSKSLQLIVEVSITFVSEPIQYAELYSSAIIKCQVREYRTVQISWFKGQDKLDITSLNYQQTNEGLKINRVSYADNDTFWCQADVIESGETNEYGVQVIVAQSITSSKIKCLLPCGVEKRTTTLICETNGSPTPQISWFYGQNNHMIVDGPSKYVMRGNRLIILNVDETDSGRYVCQASNDFDKIGQRTDYILNIIVPPSVSTIAPIEVYVDDYHQPKQASFICRMERGSHDGLSLEWRFPNNSLVKTTDQISIDTSRLITQRLIELKFNPVQRQHHGNYTCQVTNLADVTYAVAVLIVLSKPILVEPKMYKVYSTPYHAVTMECYFDSYPPPMITWFKTKTDYGAYAISLQRTSPQVIDLFMNQISPTIYATQLTYNPSEEDFSYVFICQANNTRTEEHSIKLLLAESPRPVRVSAVNPTANTIELDVQPPTESGGLPLLHFIVKYEQIGSAEQSITQLFPVVSNQSQRIEIKSLQAGSLYRLQVAVENQAGSSTFSIPVQVKTLSGVPAEFTLSNTSCLASNSCVIQWFVQNDGGSAISRIDLAYAKIDSKGGIGKLSKPISLPPNVTEYSLNELKVKTDYLVIVRLVNTAGESMKQIRIKPNFVAKCKSGCDLKPNMFVIISIIIGIVLFTFLILAAFISCRMFTPKSFLEYQRTPSSPDE